MESTEKPKKKKVSKIILILIIALVIVPLGVGSVVYNTNKSFRDKMNTKLIKAPGFVGKYFRNYPTESEKQDKKNI